MANYDVGLSIDLGKASFTKSSLQSMMKKEEDQCHVATALSITA